MDTTVSYKLRVKEHGEEYEKKITIDKDKQTETSHVDAHGQSVEADIISDFKRVRIFPVHAPFITLNNNLKLSFVLPKPILIFFLWEQQGWWWWESKSAEHLLPPPPPPLFPFHSLVYSENVFLSLQNLTMYGVPAKKVCLLGPLRDNQKPPNVLIEELEKVPKNRSILN